MQADGKVLVSGMFDTVAGVARRGIARLNTNGAVDTVFTGEAYTSGGIGATVDLKIQDDQRIIVIGNFDRINGAMKSKAARLNTDGSLDNSFSVTFDGGDSDTGIGGALILPDQRILIPGNFSVVNQINRFGLARLNSDGSTDPAFEANAGMSGSVYEIIQYGNGKFLASGFFNHFNGAMSNGIVRFNVNGSPDASFTSGLGFLDTSIGDISNGSVTALALQSDGKILAGGIFRTYNNVVRASLARINPDGTLDETWPMLPLANIIINDIAVQLDGKIIVALGASPGVRRYNSDGTIDSSFNSGGSGASATQRVLLMPDGKILVCGSFTTFNGTSRNRLARLNSNGSLDTGFNTAGGPGNNSVSSMAVQMDGRIVIGGTFTSVSSENRPRIARLNTDGALDATFNPGSGADGPVNQVLVRPNGKILMGGQFNNVNGTSRRKLAQLSSTGSLDPLPAGLDWRGVMPTNGIVNTLLLSGSGLYVGGGFYGIGSANYSGIVRLRLASSNFDYDGDGKSDVSVFRPSGGDWYLLNSSTGYTGQHFGQTGDSLAPADFDGDGKTDVAVFRASVGGWYWLNSSNGSFSAATFGQAGDLPTPADYDGDGKADVAVFRPSTGDWYRMNSSNGQFVAVHFGSSEDKPAVGDFDGDGKADISIFRPSTGSWYRLNSSNGEYVGVHFGIAEDLPTPADYDGDGKTDISVYRPLVGDWFRLNSSTGAFAATHFGGPGDKPAAADFDGDGKADITVFRPSDGNWYQLNTTAGFGAVHFGISEDLPTPNAFVY